MGCCYTTMSLHIACSCRRTGKAIGHFAFPYPQVYLSKVMLHGRSCVQGRHCYKNQFIANVSGMSSTTFSTLANLHSSIHTVSGEILSQAKSYIFLPNTEARHRRSAHDTFLYPFLRSPVMNSRLRKGENKRATSSTISC